MLRPLIVSGGGFQGVGLLECLQAVEGSMPVVADVHADNVARYRCAEYVTLPPLAREEDFARSLLALVRERGITHVFPATARELRMLASLSPELEASGARTAVSRPALVNVLLDKRATTEWLARRGLPVQGAIDPLSHDYATALFGKPVAGWGGAGTVVARTRTDAIRALEQESELHWVPLLEDFSEYSVDFAIAPDRSLSPCVLRRRARISGGFAVVSETVEDSELSALGARIARALRDDGGMGVFNVQLIVPRGGAAFVSDVNPRFGTSSVHGLAEGVNLPAYFMGVAAASDSPRIPVKSIRMLQTLSVPLLDRQPAGVVFDLDDTLVDHKLWMLRKALAAHQKVATGWNREEDFRLHMLQLVDEGERSHLIDRLAEGLAWSQDQHQAYLEAYRSVVLADTPLFPDVAPALTALTDAGVRIGILTDNPPATQQGKLANARALAHVHATVFARETGGEKPRREAFVAIANQLGLPPTELVMVGDNWFRDALGAIRAGYSRAFVLQRQGGFVQAHPRIPAWAGLHPDGASRIHRIDGLAALLASVLCETTATFPSFAGTPA